MPDDATRTGAYLTHSVADPAATTGSDTPDPAAGPTPAAGDRYVLGDEIARGGMGVVYRATDTVLGREVAVKVLQDKFGPASAAARRFGEEARITAQLQHPAIPPVHDLGTLPDGRPFLAMKLIKGDTLERLLSSRPDPAHDRGRFVAAFEAVCQAVAYAHAHGVIHRDLKPANVMVGNFGEVQVMDWGLGKVLGGRPAEGDSEETSGGTEIRSPRDNDLLTQAGSVLGTPAFMAPEQAVGAVGKIDTRSDVFGLGAILAVILTGRPPFASSTAETTRVKAAQGRVDECFARLDSCGADPGLVALCKLCLAPRQEDRPANAREVAKAVAELRQAADERARDAELDRVRAEGNLRAAELKAAEGRKRRRIQMALATAIGLLVVGGGAFAWWRDREAADRKAERDRTEAEKQATELRQQFGEQQRATEEKNRLGRNAEAVAALLGECEEALQARDVEKAALALGAAEKRATEGGAGHLADRLRRCRADVPLLRELDLIDQFRWSYIGVIPVDTKRVVARWRAAFAAAGLDPASGPPSGVADRVRASWVRDRVTTTLDLWLTAAPAAADVRAVLRTLDPDPFREAVRDATASGSAVGVAELAARPDALTQPPRFAAALGQHPDVPLQRQRAILEVALRTTPEDFPLLMTLGNTYLPDPDTTKVPAADLADRVRWYQAAVAARPRHMIALNNLGLALAQQGAALRQPGKIAEGVEYFLVAIRVDPRNAQAYYNMGVARQTQGNLDEAADWYRQTIKLLPEFFYAHANLGDVLRQKGDPDGAVACFREALKHLPGNPRAAARVLVNMGIVLRQKGDPDEAIKCFERAIKIMPGLAEAHYNLGNARVAKADIDGAIASFREAARVDPAMAQAHYNLGVLLERKGDLVGALAGYREAVRTNPKDARAHTNLGLLLARKGDTDGAVASLRTATRADPNLVQPHAHLAALFIKTGDTDEALASLREAVRLDPRRAQFHGTLGVLLARKGDLDGAAASLKEALRLDPNDPVAKPGLDAVLKQKARVDSKRPVAPPPREAKRP